MLSTNSEMKPRQLLLFTHPGKEHGGDVRRGQRKLARPLATKRPLHLVFRAVKARGARNFLHRDHKGVIHLLLLDTAERFGVKIFRYENVGNHLHLVMQGSTRAGIRAFLRVFPQKVMFQVTGARKGNPQGRFFDAIAYSRVVNWGKEFRILNDYLWKNEMEALGFWRGELCLWRDIPPKPA